MYIKNILTQGFGVFNGEEIKNLKRGVNIIEGKNEAGKSTLLNFIRYTLFGYPSRSADQCPPLNGGKHGGRIIATLSSGEDVVFERDGGSKGGKTKLRYKGEEIINSGEWQRLLGNANAQLFRNVFGISIDELSALNHLEESGIADKVFSIGIGLANVSIGKIENDLVQKADLIYKKGGSVQKIPEAWKKYENRRERLNELQKGLPRYEELFKGLSDLRKKVAELNDKILESIKKKDNLSNFIKCYGDSISILQIDRDLKKLPTVFDCLPESSLALSQLELQVSSLEQSISDLKSNINNDGIEQIEEQVKKIAINELIREEESGIVHLTQHLEKYKQSITDFNFEDEEIQSLKVSISMNILKINAAWDERTVLDFPNIIEHRDKLAQFEAVISSSKLKYEARKEFHQANIPSGNKVELPILFAIIFFVLSFPAFYYSLPVGVSFVLIALIILFFRKYLLQIDTLAKNDELKELERSYNKLKTDYNNYLLHSLNLTENLSFSAVGEVFHLIEQTQKDIFKKNTLERKQEERRLYISRFEAKVLELKERQLIAIPFTSNEQFIRALEVELRESNEAVNRRDGLLQIQQSKEQQLKEALSTLREVNMKISKLLEESKCTDIGTFKSKYHLEAQAREFIKDRKNKINTIELIVGFGNAEELLIYLKDHDKVYLEDELKRLITEIDGLEALRSVLQNEYGRVEKEMEDLQYISGLGDIATELDVERTKINNFYKEWLSKKVALSILSDVKLKYEREQQPDVIKFSSEIFSQITAGQYERINISLDDKDVTIIDSKQASKKINQLSRGTKEQLLISLRLGLIEEYEKQNEPLPIIFDDVFVNADPCRTKIIASVLEKFAVNRQIIIFTCHSSLGLYFSNAVNKVFMSEQVYSREGLSTQLWN